MIFLELIYGVLFWILAFQSSMRDLKTGIIPNQLLCVFASAGCALGIVYYGFFAGDFFVPAFMNLLIVSAVGLYLFYSHSLAGGDSKLLIVMSVLYPGRFLLTYGSTQFTLILALGIGILLGYFYLLISSALMLLRGKNKISWMYVKNAVKQFAISFVSASVYISAANLLLIRFVSSRFSLYPWLSYAICMGIAWCVARYAVLRKWYLVAGMFLTDFLLGWTIGVFPFSVRPENYLLVVILLICRMTISTNIYEQIPVRDLKAGMILSTLSSSVMQGSRVKGMPGVSSEDLRDRLTQDEVDSIGRWAGSRNVECVSVVKKIPFAVFISLGYLTYFIFWSLIR